VELADDGPQIVGMDLHRRKSVLVPMTSDGQKSATARIDDLGQARRRSRGRRGPLQPTSRSSIRTTQEDPSSYAQLNVRAYQPATMVPRSPLSGTTAAHRATHWSQASWCASEHEEVAVTSSLPGPLAQRWPIPA
jgi:hypothetical protein